MIWWRINLRPNENNRQQKKPRLKPKNRNQKLRKGKSKTLKESQGNRQFSVSYCFCQTLFDQELLFSTFRLRRAKTLQKDYMETIYFFEITRGSLSFSCCNKCLTFGRFCFVMGQFIVVTIKLQQKLSHPALHSHPSSNMQGDESNSKEVGKVVKLWREGESNLIWKVINV